MCAVDPSHIGDGSMSHKQGQTRAHHRVLDLLLMSTRGTQGVSRMTESSEMMESREVVERCMVPEVVERRK